MDKREEIKDLDVALVKLKESEQALADLTFQYQALESQIESERAILGNLIITSVAGEARKIVENQILTGQ